jgi:hypothetical protein
MGKKCCHDCVYAIRSAMMAICGFASGWGVRMLCVNHADSPGKPRNVGPGGACRNFHPKHKPPVRVEPPPPPSDDVRYIGLTRGLFVIVDAADYDCLNKYRWHAMGTDRHPYAVRMAHRRLIRMHNVILPPPPGKVVDHINGNTLDNRRCNLRICTIQENSFNRRPSSKTGLKGVNFHRGKWDAQIGHNGKQITIGSFATKEEAVRARDAKAIELWGEYAWLNDPAAQPPPKPKDG